MSNIKPSNEYQPAVYNEFLGFAAGDYAYKNGRGYAIKLANCEFADEDRPTSARGHKQLGTGTYNDNRIREILQFRRSGVDVLLVFGTNEAGTSGGIAKVTDQWTSSLAFTEILSLTDYTTNAVLFQAYDLAYLFNGTDNQFYDGTSWYEIGVDAPSTGATLNSTISGSLNTSSDYVIGWAWYDSTNRRRSNVSPLLTVTTGATSANAGIRIDLPGMAAPSGFDQIVILCTNAFGSQLFEDQFVSALATTVDITQSDSLRANQFIYEGGFDAPSVLFDVAVFTNGKIYGARTDDGQCRVYRSKSSAQFGPQPQAFPATYFADCEPSASDEILGFGVCGPKENQTVIVVKQKTFGKLVKLSDDVETYQKISDIGGLGQKSIFEFGELCGFVSESDVIVTDGSSFKRISGGIDGQAISKYLKENLSQDFKTRVYAKNITKDKQIRISAIPAGQAWNKVVLIGHYGRYDSAGIIKWTTREQGPDTSTYPGLQVASMAEVLDDSDKLKIVYGNSQGNGKLYEGDTGNTDDGNSIYKEWIFYPENFGNYRDEKIVSDIIAKIRVGDASTSIFFGYRKNLTNSTTSVTTKTFSGSGFIFGTSQFGITTLTSSPIEDLIIPNQVRCRNFALVMRETTTKQVQLLDFTLTGLP